MSRASKAVPVLLLLLATACDDGDETALSPGTARLSFVSFNAAQLAGLAPHPEQRLEATERDLPSLDADVICVQELWQPGDLTGVARAVESALPYAHWSFEADGDAVGGDAPACTTEEAERLSGCLLDNCGGIEGSALALCAVQSCADEFNTVSAACQQCIASNQSTDLESITVVCASGEGAASYTDQTGLLLLSRLPLSEVGYRAYDSSLGDRGALWARVETELAGTVDVYCTHLAATLSDAPYVGPYGSWEGERAAQLEQYLDYVSETRAPGGAVALLGDMNCGPETERARAAAPDTFARFGAEGFSAPYAELDGRCTWCSDNPLTGSGDGEAELGAILDHVLLSGFDAVGDVGATRVLDEQVRVLVDGEEVMTTRSDHYGVQVTIDVGSEP